MGYSVILSPKAVRDLEAIVRYVSLTNLSAGRRVGESLIEKIKEISQLPSKGQKVPEFDLPNIRQLILKPYPIVYRVEEDKKRISIARFWHSSQNNLSV